MRLSVYTLYVGACLLAVVAAILSGVILLGQGVACPPPGRRRRKVSQGLVPVFPLLLR